MRIVKIIPYYGAWPAYMHLYLESCRRNPILEVAFVTDLGPFPGSPPNVRYHQLPLQALRERITRTFKIDAEGVEPYKLCDFRPAFAALFPEIVAGADFWGYGDIDMILGDLSRILTTNALERYDILSFKKGHLQGPLSFYRNDGRVNELFREGGRYREVFARPDYLSFDEFGPNVFYVGVQRPEEVLQVASDNISVIAFKAALTGSVSVYCEQHGREALGLSDLVEYRDGRVLDANSGTEHLFYHWVLEKRALWFRYPTWVSDRPSRFFIAATGFYSEREMRSFPVRHALRILSGTFRWWKLKSANYVRRRLRRPVTVDTYPRLGWVKPLTPPGGRV